MNLQINKEKLLVEQKLEKEKAENQTLLNQLTLLNTMHLGLVKQKNKLTNRTNQSTSIFLFFWNDFFFLFH